MSVVDADNDFVDSMNSTGVQTGFLWALDHLEPGQTYYAIVVATDENDDSSYAYGQFTTLSERTVHVTIGDATIEGGPQYNHGVYFDLEVDGEFSTSFTPTLPDVDRHLDLRLWVRLYYDGNLCEYLPGPDDNWGPHGYSEDHCVVWNSALLDKHRPRRIPGAGQGTWTTRPFRKHHHRVERRCRPRRWCLLHPLQRTADAVRHVQLQPTLAVRVRCRRKAVALIPPDGIRHRLWVPAVPSA